MFNIILQYMTENRVQAPPKVKSWAYIKKPDAS